MSVITVTPTVELGTTPPRVRLDVSDSGLPGYTQANVVRHDPNGETVPVRTPSGGPVTLATSGANRVGVVYDYEAPFGQAVTYSTAESPTVISASVVSGADQVWLIHPGVPELSRPVIVAEFGERIRRTATTVYRPMGRRTGVPHSDGQRKAPEYALTLRTDNETERVGLEALTEDAGTLLLNVPASNGWGIGAEYLSVGDLAEARLWEYAGEQRRYWTLPCTVVERPAGGTQAERTMLDLMVYPTLAQLAAAYPNLAAVLAGP